MAAMVVAPNAIRLVNNSISRWLTTSQTTTRRSRQGQSLGLGTREPDQLVRPDVAVLRNRTLLNHVVGGILLQAGDKVDFLDGPFAEQPVVVIPAIHGHDGAGVEREGVGHL